MQLLRSFSSLLFVVALFTSHFVDAQRPLRTDMRTINWEETPGKLVVSENEVVTRPTFQDAFYERSNYLPQYRERLSISSDGRLKVTLTDQQWEPLAFPELIEGVDLPTSITPKAWVQTERKQPVGIVSFIPMRRNPVTGQAEQLVAFKLDYEVLPKRKVPGAADQQRRQSGFFNSALSTGTWFKIAVEADGVYRIDKDFLESLGINTATLNPATFGVFGNGGGMVPLDNSEFRHDDIQENAIRIVGEGDGSFDDGDYILFYGQGPDRWWHDPEDGRYKHRLHNYEDKTYYFITPDQGTGKRVGNMPSHTDPATVTVTQFDDYAFIDDEQVNLLQSGRNWFGDFVDGLTDTRSYSMSFPNRVDETPIWFRANAAARSAVANSDYVFTVNGNPVASMNLPSITIGFDRLYASSQTVETEVNTTGDDINIDYICTACDASAKGWLNYIEVNARREIRVTPGQQLHFRNSETMGLAFVSHFIVQTSNPVEVWNVTDPTTAAQMELTSPVPAEFRLETSDLHEFVAFTDADALPSTLLEVVGPVANQNLHNPPEYNPDYLVIAHPDFIDQARRLAAHHHDKDGMDTLVTNVFKIYNEYSSGGQDISAIRDYIKFFYDNASTTDLLDNVLLFGDGSYDYKNVEYAAEVNSNFIPTFQSTNSTHPIFSFTSDDFYGFLDEAEGGSFITSDTIGIDIGLGRLPVRTPEQAKTAVDKILHYVEGTTFGSWRNTITFVADDEDNNTHINDADEIAQNVVAPNYPLYNIDKIYLDAYQQVSASGGERYPDAKEAINNRIFSGTLIVNYTGHGSERTWAKEAVMEENDINSWENIDKLTLFVTATCSFSRYDNPGETSAGEQTFLNENGGAIGLITTVRLVFSFANFQINREIYRSIFEPEEDGQMPTLGKVVQNAKNKLSVASSDGENNRKFTLLGDPAMKLAYPEYNVVTTAINGIAGSSDTLSALQKVTIAGEVRGTDGSLLEDFNGVVSPTIYDKASLISTLVNDPDKSNLKNFVLQKNIIYRGNASVTNGEFEFEFIVPKDISYTFGNGKISYYAQDGTSDAAGFDTELIIGGTADSAATDNEGPVVEVFMNDESFAFGGITDESPVLLVRLEDESGINTVGNGIGHDITSILDDDDQSAVTLNDFYEADLDSYQTGSVQYRLDELEAGRHAISVKAWDVYNNSGEGYTEFIVADGAELALNHVLNYPNPFTTRTEFMFEHNRPGDMMSVKVEIFTVSGKRIKTIVRDVVTDGFRVDGIEWDGLDDFGDNIGRGVYVYKVSVRSLSDPEVKSHHFEKLVLLR